MDTEECNRIVSKVKHEWENRALKAVRFSDWISVLIYHGNETLDSVRNYTEDQWLGVAEFLNENRPSSATRNLVIKILEERFLPMMVKVNFN